MFVGELKCTDRVAYTPPPPMLPHHDDNTLYQENNANMIAHLGIKPDPLQNSRIQTAQIQAGEYREEGGFDVPILRAGGGDGWRYRANRD